MWTVHPIMLEAGLAVASEQVGFSIAGICV
jgi:hypothetical protein